MNTGPLISQRLADAWASNVVARRKALGLSQEQVAELSGLTQQGVSQIESGAVLARDDSKVALCRALGTRPDVLFPWPPMEELIGGAA